MEQRVHKMIGEVIAREGGYVNHPADRGGATNYGITQAAYSDYLGRRASVEDIRAITPEIATEIYYTRYYLQPRIDALPLEIQPIMLDMCVHHGAKKAILILQRVINLAEVAVVKEDGICGIATQQAAQKAQAAMGSFLLNALVDERLSFFHRIVGNNPSQMVFLRGWEKRAESFRV